MLSRRATLAGLGAGLPAPALAAPGARVALVIGNGDNDGRGGVAYSPDAVRDAAERGFVGDLPNAGSDARLVANTLRDLGYDVRSAFDADRGMMMGALMQFAAQTQAAGPDCRSVFYYSGHGVQIFGNSYLVPARSRMLMEDTSAPNFDFTQFAIRHAVPLMEIMARVRARAAPGFNLLMLDCCRDNPWAQIIRQRTGLENFKENALTALSTPPRTVVAYASMGGGLALDGVGVNGPFAQAFSRWAKRRDMPLDTTLARMLGEVGAAGGGKQMGWTTGRLLDQTTL